MKDDENAVWYFYDLHQNFMRLRSGVAVLMKHERDALCVKGQDSRIERSRRRTAKQQRTRQLTADGLANGTWYQPERKRPCQGATETIFSPCANHEFGPSAIKSRNPKGSHLLTHTIVSSQLDQLEQFTFHHRLLSSRAIKKDLLLLLLFRTDTSYDRYLRQLAPSVHCQNQPRLSIHPIDGEVALRQARHGLNCESWVLVASRFDAPDVLVIPNPVKRLPIPPVPAELRQSFPDLSNSD